VTDLGQTLKDAAYVTVGLAVLGFQRAQVRRRELTRDLRETRRRLEHRGADVGAQVTRLVRDVDQSLDPLVALVEQGLDGVERRLPGPARDTLRVTREATRQARAEVRARLAPEDRTAGTAG
jgi:hypothetical protein